MAKRAKRVPKRTVASKKRQLITTPRPQFAVSKGALSRARFKVAAGWDPEAKVWYIASSNLPGLHLEGATPQELYNQLPGAIEDLLEGSGQREISFDFITPVEIMPGRVKIAA